MIPRKLLSALLLLLILLILSCHKTEIVTIEPGVMGFTDAEWLLVAVNGVSLLPPAAERIPSLKFDPAKREASGFSGCNNYFSRYEADGSALTFGPVGATRMACPETEMNLETTFLQALENTRTWRMMDNELVLLDENEVIARFKKNNIDKTKPGITGPAWQWIQTYYNDDTKVIPADPENYTIQFLEAGNVTVKADCNMKGGTFTLEDKRITIQITHSTMAVCPEGSLEDAFVHGLSATAIYFFNDGDLYIDLMYDSGTMRFSRSLTQVR